MRKILVVEDDRDLLEFVSRGLQEAGFSVEEALNAFAAYEILFNTEVDLVILDLMLPDMDGFEFLKKLRKRRPRLPILILSARSSVDDRVRGLELGSDDYLTKPFSFAELLARVKSLLRRASQSPEMEEVLSAGPIRLDLLRREVRVGEKRVELSPREFALLEYLMRHKGRVLTRIQILEKIWGYHFSPESNIVDVYICRLREKLGLRRDSRPTIRTIRQVGYTFTDED
ncbi:response regulator transcription factor [Thermosulfurimonas dismutans]|uniref:Two component transcriptional regulator, winged helix family n=1 Tax=Thermosulfurimonas dismutans TaxID=999894 RepID=A0A179D2X8_9BACT|nr:response regulator transcription factor [Thermosulfurimonas dismutans]OAQ20151.1 two component transcriptional regulator, winged helix family [Thermosulfurimonas dismutans]